MFKTIKWLVSSLCILISTQSLAESLKPIYLATTPWCPYACENANEGQGIVFDYLKYVLKKEGYDLNIGFFPWTRSIKLATSGKVDGLLTAVHSEAPSLLFTNVATMNYRMCFYTDTTSNWFFTGADSLKETSLAIIQDYGYGEPLDSYINSNNTNGLFELSGDNSLLRLTSLQKKGRFSVFIEDENVVNRQSKIDDITGYKQAGCLESIPFYIAFDPNFAIKHNIISKLDTQLNDIHNQTYLIENIMPKYLK